jgi:hypothetical protein
MQHILCHIPRCRWSPKVPGLAATLPPAVDRSPISKILVKWLPCLLLDLSARRDDLVKT